MTVQGHTHARSLHHAGTPEPTGKGSPVTRRAYSGPAEFGVDRVRQHISGGTRSVEGVQLFHFTFNQNCQHTGEDRFTPFTGGLSASHSIRVHTGSGQVWQEGTVWHIYLQRSNYVWNNRCGDTAVLRDSTGGLIDWASYLPGPEEGRVLQRISGTNTLR